MKFIPVSVLSILLATSLSAFAAGEVTCPGANLIKKSSKLLDTVSIFSRRGPSDYNVFSYATLRDTNHDWHLMLSTTAKGMDAALTASQATIKTAANSLNETAIEMNGALLCGYDTSDSPMAPSIFAVAMSDGLTFSPSENIYAVKFDRS